MLPGRFEVGGIGRAGCLQCFGKLVDDRWVFRGDVGRFVCVEGEIEELAYACARVFDPFEAVVPRASW